MEERGDEADREADQPPELPESIEITPEMKAHDKAKSSLMNYLNKRMRIAISDGRVIDGNFLCTDRDCNIVLGNCEEFLSREEVGNFENKISKCVRQPRTLGLAIVPGEHIISIAIAKDSQLEPHPQAPAQDLCVEETHNTPDDQLQHEKVLSEQGDGSNQECSLEQSPTQAVLTTPLTTDGMSSTAS